MANRSRVIFSIVDVGIFDEIRNVYSLLNEQKYAKINPVKSVNLFKFDRSAVGSIEFYQ
jgi:hypothetical protein